MEPILRFPGSDRTIHLDIESETWFVTVAGRCYAISNGDIESNISVLPFLELPLSQVEETVAKFAARYGDVKFPFELFIKAGLKHGSPHWTDCSLTWLAEIDRLEASFQDDLEKIVENTKRYSQKSRQLAKKLIKQGR